MRHSQWSNRTVETKKKMQTWELQSFKIIYSGCCYTIQTYKHDWICQTTLPIQRLQSYYNKRTYFFPDAIICNNRHLKRNRILFSQRLVNCHILLNIYFVCVQNKMGIKGFEKYITSNDNFVQQIHIRAEIGKWKRWVFCLDMQFYLVYFIKCEPKFQRTW